MRRHFAIVLLFGVLAMNMDIICQSLCLSTHNDTHQSHHDMPQSSIKCDCSVDQAASLGFEFTSADAALDVTPYLRMVSAIQPQSIIFLSQEPIPLEGPPKILVPLESSVLKA